jgi:DNA-binding transcriptional LysR family regulator
MAGAMATKSSPATGHGRAVASNPRDTSGKGRAQRTKRRVVRPPRLYEYFDAIVRHGSIRRAAEALGVASSALNRRLLDFEADVGASLFERLPRGVRLTAAGEVFAGHVRRMLSDLEQAGSQIQALQGLMRGHVAIAAAESVAVEFLPRVIAEFRRLHPGVHFTVRVGTPQAMVVDLVEDRVDLVLTHEQPRHHDVMTLASAPQSFCALLAPDHPLAGRDTLRLRDCHEFPIVLADETLAGRSLIEATLAKASLHFRPVLVTNMIQVMKQFVRNDHAICFQFRIGAEAEIARGELVAIPLVDPPLAQTQLLLVARRGRVLPVAAAAFAEMLCRRLDQSGAR